MYARCANILIKHTSKNHRFKNIEKQQIMNTTIHQRIKQIVDNLCNGNMSEMGRITGINQQIIRSIVRDEISQPGFDTLHKIAINETLQIDSDWLLTGVGEMQKGSTGTMHKNGYPTTSPKPIPVYNIAAARSLRALHKNADKYKVGELQIIDSPDCDGALYMRGDTMHPIIRGNDLVAYKMLKSATAILSNEMYIVEYELGDDHFMMVRRAYSEDQNKSLRLVANNEQYGDVVIPISAIRCIALIKMSVRF